MITRAQLHKSAMDVLRYSYCPYSQFKVGAALSTNDDKIFTGCNIENISFGLTICAERVALFKAISEGYKKFDAIAICSDNGKPIFPCGACRQMLSEFTPHLRIYIHNMTKSHSLKDLLPYSFDSIT